MNTTILRGIIQQYQGRYFQWTGRRRNDRFSIIHGRQLQRNGELIEAFGRFQNTGRLLQPSELDSLR